jgi:hypothetical protein
VVAACGGERAKTEEEITAEQLQNAGDSLRDDAGAIGGGLLIDQARTQLTVLGLWDRFGITSIRQAGGNLAILTKLPSVPASRNRAAEICDALVGGDPPALDLPGRIAVVSDDRKLIRATECGT